MVGVLQRGCWSAAELLAHRPPHAASERYVASGVKVFEVLVHKELERLTLTLTLTLTPTPTLTLTLTLTPTLTLTLAQELERRQAADGSEQWAGDAIAVCAERVRPWEAALHTTEETAAAFHVLRRVLTLLRRDVALLRVDSHLPLLPQCGWRTP